MSGSDSLSAALRAPCDAGSPRGTMIHTLRQSRTPGIATDRNENIWASQSENPQLSLVEFSGAGHVNITKSLFLTTAIPAVRLTELTELATFDATT